MFCGVFNSLGLLVKLPTPKHGRNSESRIQGFRKKLQCSLFPCLIFQVVAKMSWMVLNNGATRNGIGKLYTIRLNVYRTN